MRMPLWPIIILMVAAGTVAAPPGDNFTFQVAVLPRATTCLSARRWSPESTNFPGLRTRKRQLRSRAAFPLVPASPASVASCVSLAAYEGKTGDLVFQASNASGAVTEFSSQPPSIPVHRSQPYPPVSYLEVAVHRGHAPEACAVSRRGREAGGAGATRCGMPPDNPDLFDARNFTPAWPLISASRSE